MRFTGVVESGHGAARRDVLWGVYPVGYEPHPGTLNLSANLDVERLGAPSMVVEFAGIARSLWPCRLLGVSGHVMHYGKPGRFEVLAPVRLRDHLDDGDSVEVTVP